MCDIVGHSMISTYYICRSFQDTGLYPFNLGFSKRFRNEDGENQNKALKIKRKLRECGPACSLRGVKSRKADGETYEELVEIIHKERKTRATQRIQFVLQSARAASSILLDVGKPNEMNTAGCVSNRTAPDWGAPGVYLTVEELMTSRKDKERAKEQKRKLTKCEKIY